MLVEIKDLGQGPYFAITGNIRCSANGRVLLGGSIHDEIAKAFPEFQKYIKWHLCNVNDGPMHYIANALYFAGYTSYLDGMNLDNLKSTVAWGAVDSDHDIDIASLMNNENLANTSTEAIAKSIELKAVLLARFPQLLEKMHEDFIELFVPSFQDLVKK